VKLGEVCEFIRGVTYEKSDESSVSTAVAVLRANNINVDSHTLDRAKIKYLREDVGLPAEKRLRKGDIFICTASGSKDHLGKVAFITEDIPYFFGGFMGAIRSKAKALPNFVFHLLTSPAYDGFIQGLTAGVNINNLKGSDLLSFKLPLPPLEEQERIVAELGGYRKIIEGARQIIANYKPTIKIDPKWPMVKLGEVCRQERGIASSKSELQLPYLGLEDIESGTGRIHSNTSTNKAVSTSFAFGSSHVLYSKLRPYLNKVALPDFKGRCTTELIPILPSDRIQRTYLFWLLLRQETVTVAMGGKTGTQMPRADMELIMNMEIPVPPLAIQRKIVAKIEAEQVLVEANRKLAEIFEEKIQAKLAEIWGEGTN
ncbi:MAG: restriction endonuclease subunit S, partial [Proteobacteria bacterium]|nr:restriction endonuclease subunit S [Pseudomonadota bacterium]